MSGGSQRVGFAPPGSTTDLAGRIGATPVETVPFEHLYLDQVFPPDEYQRLLDHLPETRRYRELTHREAVRRHARTSRSCRRPTRCRCSRSSPAATTIASFARAMRGVSPTG